MDMPSSPSDYPPGYLQQTIGAKLVAVSAAFITLDVIFVCLRYYARRLSNTPRGWDDILMGPALILNIGTCALCIYSVHHAGVGQHLPAVVLANPASLMTWGKVIFSLLLLYSNSVAFPKLSILALYLRIFTEKPYRITAWILAFIISGTAFAVSITAVFQCSPIKYAWDKTIHGGHCIDVALFYVYCSVPNVITDVAILLLPIPMIFKLHTSRGQKIGLLMVFLLGTIGLISSCVRLVVFARNNAFKDQTWRSVTLMSWTVIESSIYLIAACLPSLRPLLHSVFHHQVFGKSYWSKGTQSTSGEHSRAKRSARTTLNGADGFQRLNGEAGDISTAERGEHGIQTTSSGGVNQKDDHELAQLNADGRIRITNAFEVEYENSRAHMPKQDGVKN